MSKDATAGIEKSGEQVDWPTTVGWIFVVGGAIWLFITLVMGQQGTEFALLKLGETDISKTFSMLTKQWQLYPCLVGFAMGVFGCIRKRSKNAFQLTAVAAILLVLGAVRGLLP